VELAGVLGITFHGFHLWLVAWQGLGCVAMLPEDGSVVREVARMPSAMGESLLRPGQSCNLVRFHRESVRRRTGQHKAMPDFGATSLSARRGLDPNNGCA